MTREELLPTALPLAEELAAKPPLALAAARYEILRAADPRIDESLAYELDLGARLFGSRDQREGMRAFLEKKVAPPRDRSGLAESSAGFPRAEPGGSEAELGAGGKRKRNGGSGRD